MPQILARPSFGPELLALKSSARKTYKTATEILIELQLGQLPTALLRADRRIPQCQKYELQDGYRLVFQRAGNGDVFIALVVGKHEHVDAFLDTHRGTVFDPAACEPLRMATQEVSSRTLSDHRGVAVISQTASVAADRGGNTAAPPPSRRALFSALSDDELLAIGVQSGHLAGLRAEYEGADSPALVSVLESIQYTDSRLADLLWSHAIEPSNVSLSALIAHRPRTERSQLEHVPDHETQERMVASPPGPKSGRRRKSTVKRSKPRQGKTRAKAEGRPRQATPRRQRAREIINPTKRSRTRISDALSEFLRAGGTLVSTRAPLKAPALPKRMSVLALRRYLDAHGFRLTDNRAVGGGLWVLAPKRSFQSLADELSNRGITCKYFPGGTRKREHRPSWLIDAFNRLT